MQGSVDISRKAELYETSSGMLTITGGKLTTWRRMGKQTVDRIVERAGRTAPCLTDQIPLGLAIDPADIEPPEGVGEEAVRQLAFRYGHLSEKVLDLIREDRDLGREVVEGMPDLMAEVVWAVENEQARDLDDVLLRRTRLGLTAARDLSDAESVAPVADLMADRLGWGEAEKASRIEGWLETVEAEGLNPAGGQPLARVESE
jgi:glycerol-3-phosphate dehydrogenase